MPSEDSSTDDRCKCGHIAFRHEHADRADTHCLYAGCGCGCYVPRSRAYRALMEPPLTPEEEEEAPCPHESWDVTSEWFDHLSRKWHKSRRCNDCRESLDVVFEDEPHWPNEPAEDEPAEDEPEQPQPERRPPLAYAYSVKGHLYEVALPGDATVQAMDGALIITHTLGPVAGIVRARPMESPEGES